MIEVETPTGRRFALIGREPYQRKDGTMTELCVWQSCCVCCGEPYQVRTPGKVRRFEGSKSFLVATCPQHRGKGRRRAKS